MKFECPNCKKSGQVDDSKVPESGVYATCPQCNNRFLVKREVPKDFKFEPVEPAIQKVQSNTTSAQNASSGEPSKPKTNASPNTTDDITYYKAAIGKNFEKYIDVIKAIQAGNAKPVSWHWPAFLLGPTWLIYRKMYGVLFLYLLVAIMSDLLASFKPVLGVIFLGLGAVFAVYAKSIYVKHVSKKIESCGQMPHADKINKLQADCGTNTWIFYFGIIPVIGIIAAIAIPQYNAYKQRALKKEEAPAPAPAVETDIWAGLTEPNAPAPTPKTVPAVDASTPVDFNPFDYVADKNGFIIDEDVVTDTSTGLMWTRNGNIAGKQMTRLAAMSWLKNLSYGGYNDWRLPTKEEFYPFAMRGGDRAAESFNANGFNNVQSSYYWSSSAYTNNTVFVMFMGMGHGDFGKARQDCYVWPVRGGR